MAPPSCAPTGATGAAPSPPPPPTPWPTNSTAARWTALDKLVRGGGDSLTAAGLIKDDARIVALRAMKIEVDGWTGATISVHEIGNEPADEVIW